MIYHLRLLIDLKQREVVRVNIQRANVHLRAFEIALAVAPIVVDLLSPAREGVQERRDLAVGIFLVERDAKTESYKRGPIGQLQSGCNVPTIEPFPRAEPVEYTTRKFDGTIHRNRIVITKRMLTENVADPFDDSVDGNIQAAQWHRFLLFEHAASVHVSKAQTGYRLTLSRPYLARRLETSSDGVMECDSSESKKREGSGRPLLTNSSTCSSRMESNSIFCLSASNRATTLSIFSPLAFA